MSMKWLQGAMLAVNRAVSDIEKRETARLDYACRLIVNTAKQYAPYKDDTGHLRNGYGHKVVEVGRGNRVGVVFNRMEYAPHVEFTPNYWVLSGAVNMLRAELLTVLGNGMDVRMLKGTGGNLGVFRMGF